MEINIGTYDPATRTVPVTFTHTALDAPFERAVNACHDSDGNYDEAATAARVDQVALGVEAKISLGVIRPVELSADIEPTPAE